MFRLDKSSLVHVWDTAGFTFKYESVHLDYRYFARTGHVFGRYVCRDITGSRVAETLAASSCNPITFARCCFRAFVELENWIAIRLIHVDPQGHNERFLPAIYDLFTQHARGGLILSGSGSEYFFKMSLNNPPKRLECGLFFTFVYDIDALIDEIRRAEAIARAALK
jgi:hypothetical protein